MSGARLQALGQVRNVYPYVSSKGVSLALSVPVATFRGEVPIPMDRSEVPFNIGPDKSSRVFVTILGVSYIVSGDAGTTSVASGALYYRNGGKFHYLDAVSATLATAMAFNSDRIITPAFPLFTDSNDNIGYIGFENYLSVAGTAANLLFAVRLNIGLYGDYAEPDWTELFTLPVHDHVGLSNYRDEND
jgi:hypothetical protein